MMTRLLPILAIALAAGVFFGYVHPTYVNKIVALQTEIKNDNDALAGAKAFTNKEAALALEENQIPPEQLARLAQFLPDGVDNVQLILDLDALAARSGVQLSGFNVRESSQEQNAASSTSFSVLSQSSAGNATNSLDLSVTATGSYSAFRSFLAGVELSLRPLDVTEASVTDSATGIYTYTMNIRLYWLH